MNYLLHILVMFDIYLILALAMNLLAGQSGLLSLCQAAFYGLGAYAAALLMTVEGWGFLQASGAAIAINIMASLPVVWFSIRLRDLFFALATLSWQIIVFAVLYNWVGLTNGPFGVAGIPKPSLGGISLDSLPAFAFFSTFVGAAIVFLYVGFSNTPYARVLRGVRDDQLAAISFGKRPSYYKATAILLSSGTSAIAGVLFASYYSYIDPTSFTLDESILIISIVLIGGLDSVKGAVAGALFYILLPEALRFLPLPDAGAANLRMMIYAMVLILVVMYRPYGFFGKYRFE